MFGFFKRKGPPVREPSSVLRDTLFGDMPLDRWPVATSEGRDLEPWSTFVRAREAVGYGRQADAVAHWRRITTMPDLESRHYLQAWNFLRAHGVQPPAEEASSLLGVVVEVPMNGGLDLLAAYRERTARYYNYSGGGVVWERPDESLDRFIDDLLHAGEEILRFQGSSDTPRPPAPPPGHIRLNFLAPSGLVFGQGPFQAMASDPIAKAAISAATLLMQQLIAQGGRP